MCCGVFAQQNLIMLRSQNLAVSRSHNCAKRAARASITTLLCLLNHLLVSGDVYFHAAVLGASGCGVI
jgi:hypothetical protein